VQIGGKNEAGIIYKMRVNWNGGIFMKKMNTRKLALLAMMIALTTVGTILVQIPAIVAHGYINFGDTFLMLTGLLLGPAAGMVAGGLGSALSDLISGYAIYAPITLIVKGLEGFLCGWIYKKQKQKHAIAAALAGGILMVLGYFIGECFLYGPAGAAASVFGNSLQGVTNALLATLLNRQLSRVLKKVIYE